MFFFQHWRKNINIKNITIYIYNQHFMSVKPAKIERTQRLFEIYLEDTEESHSM